MAFALRFGEDGGGMKLLLISESPLDRVGNDYYAVDSWINFPRHLAGRCSRFTLWSPVRVLPAGAPPAAGSWRLEPGDMRIAPHDYYSSFFQYLRLWPSRRSAWARRADELIAKHDVVILRLPSPMFSIVVRSARRRRRPLVLLVAGNILTQSDRFLSSRGVARLFYWIIIRLMVVQEKIYARHAALVCVYSKELERRHQSLGPKRLYAMRTPLLSAADFFQREDTCQSEEIRLLRVAWLLPSKGLESLLQAVAIMTGKGLRVRLEIVGKERAAGYQKKLEDLARTLGIENRVTFTQWVAFDRMREVYIRSDIQVMSSLAEAMPRCIVEGAARGLPLVCTTVGACMENLRDGEEALMVPPGDAEAIAGAVGRIVRDADLRRAMIRHGYAMARSVSFEDLGMRFLTKMSSLAGPESAPGD